MNALSAHQLPGNVRLVQLALHQQFPHQHGKSGATSKYGIGSACAERLLCACVCVQHDDSAHTHTQSEIITGAATAASTTHLANPPAWVSSGKGMSMQVY